MYVATWGEPERAPPRALQRLRSLSHGNNGGTSCSMRMREVYVASSKVSRGKRVAQGKRERYRCASESADIGRCVHYDEELWIEHGTL